MFIQRTMLQFSTHDTMFPVRAQQPWSDRRVSSQQWRDAENQARTETDDFRKLFYTAVVTRCKIKHSGHYTYCTKVVELDLPRLRITIPVELQ